MRDTLDALISEMQMLCADVPYQAPDDRERAYNSGYVHGLNRAIAAVRRQGNVPTKETHE